jgi:SOS-response transcriptional repressor LexA
MRITALERQDIRRIRLNEAFKEHMKNNPSSSRSKFGELFGASSPTISSLLSGNPQGRGGIPMRITDKRAAKIEKAIGKPLGWLDIPPNSIKASIDSNFEFPVPVKVLSKCKISKVQPLLDGTLEDLEYESSHFDYSSDAFAIILEGDSMARLNGDGLVDGSTVIIDPNVNPDFGDVVLAFIENKSAYTLRRLTQDAGQSYLIAINPAYKSIEVDDSIKIVGVAMESNLRVVLK